jgi:hypothetical protein
MNNQISKIKIDGETNVEVTYQTVVMAGEKENERAVKNEFNAKLKHRVHQDLYNALQKLVPHVLQICELVDPKKGLDQISKDKLESITVTGVSMGGEDEDQGVVITARKKLKHNRTIAINTPFIKFDPDMSKYDYADQLRDECIDLEREVQLYMVDKHAPEPQLSLDFD